MAGDLSADGPSAPALVRRFELPTRLVHWSLAVPFLLLLLTGLTNYAPALKAVRVGDVRVFAWLHVVLGFAMLGIACAVLVGLVRSRTLRADLRAVSSASMSDYLWLQDAGLRLLGGASVTPPAAKFNAGQKLNALVSAGATAGLLLTGFVLGVNYITKRIFSVGFVASVFPWHTALALLIIPVIAGHIYLATVNPSTRESLRGMALGVVRRDWARRHHPAWTPDPAPPHDG